MNAELTLTAVRCAMCGTLHDVAGATYLVLQGTLRSRRAERGHLQDQVLHLGTEDKPTILCDDRACLMKKLLPGDY